MELQRGQRVVNTFRGIKGSENPFLNYEALEELGVDEFGTIGYIFSEFYEEA